MHSLGILNFKTINIIFILLFTILLFFTLVETKIYVFPFEKLKRKTPNYLRVSRIFNFAIRSYHVKISYFFYVLCQVNEFARKIIIIAALLKLIKQWRIKLYAYIHLISAVMTTIFWGQFIQSHQNVICINIPLYTNILSVNSDSANTFHVLKHKT